MKPHILKVKMNLTIISNAVTESNVIIPSGSIVQYVGHIVGGLVQVVYQGKPEVIDPRTTKELG